MTLGGEFWRALPDIIKEAAASPLGILALIIIAISVLIYTVIKIRGGSFSATASVALIIVLIMAAGLVTYEVLRKSYDKGYDDGIPPAQIVGKWKGTWECRDPKEDCVNAMQTYTITEPPDAQGHLVVTIHHEPSNGSSTPDYVPEKALTTYHCGQLKIINPTAGISTLTVDNYKMHGFMRRAEGVQALAEITAYRIP
jgi:hypothetical protein